MKTLWIPTATLILILAFSLWAGQYTAAGTDRRLALLERADILAREGRWDEAGRVLETAHRDWEGDHTFYHAVMKHGELDEAEALFVGARAACRHMDSDEFHILLAQLTHQMRLLAQSQTVSTENIL